MRSNAFRWIRLRSHPRTRSEVFIFSLDFFAAFLDVKTFLTFSASAERVQTTLDVFGQVQTRLECVEILVTFVLKNTSEATDEMCTASRHTKMCVPTAPQNL